MSLRRSPEWAWLVSLKRPRPEKVKLVFVASIM
jgi:hypothetical protein